MSNMCITVLFFSLDTSSQDHIEVNTEITCIFISSLHSSNTFIKLSIARVLIMCYVGDRDYFRALADIHLTCFPIPHFLWNRRWWCVGGGILILRNISLYVGIAFHLVFLFICTSVMRVRYLRRTSGMSSNAFHRMLVISGYYLGVGFCFEQWIIISLWSFDGQMFYSQDLSFYDL